MKREMHKVIRQALKEDITNQDVTTNYLVPKDHMSEAYILFKEQAVVCGIDYARHIFQTINPKCRLTSKFKDGAIIRKGTRVARINGPTRALLKGERTALNFMAYLSGIATKTQTFVRAVKGTKAQILDTRKTTPGLRLLDKYAVRTGGGVNHRFNLKEMVLIKDNHREVCHPQMSTAEVVLAIKRRAKKVIAVEVDTLTQFKAALSAEPDIILLDNMTTAQMRRAVQINNDAYKKRITMKKPLLEASGGITIKNVAKIAALGIDRISLGCLTHTHQAIDVSMEIIN